MGPVMGTRGDEDEWLVHNSFTSLIYSHKINLKRRLVRLCERIAPNLNKGTWNVFIKTTFNIAKYYLHAKKIFRGNNKRHVEQSWMRISPSQNTVWSRSQSKREWKQSHWAFAFQTLSVVVTVFKKKNSKVWVSMHIYYILSFAWEVQ